LNTDADHIDAADAALPFPQRILDFVDQYGGDATFGQCTSINQDNPKQTIAHAEPSRP